jgi:hypothetical protein
LRLQPVDPSHRAEVRRFVALPFSLYRGSPQWVPPVRSEARLALRTRRHPFYRHSEAAFFLVEDGKRALGRIAVADHHNYNSHHGTRTAFFWCFETVDDAAVTGLLLDAAASATRKPAPSAAPYTPARRAKLACFDHSRRPATPAGYPPGPLHPSGREGRAATVGCPPLCASSP